MKFVKEVTGEKMAIPAAALKLCGFENGDKAELHALPSAAIILKQKMTAMEVIRAMDALHQLTVDLSVHLARASGPCDGCDGDCPFDGLDGQEIALPDYLREEAGIPENAKLCAYVDEDENTVTIAEAGYARVSSDSEDQVNSYIAQVDFYSKHIAGKEDWEMVDIYSG